MEQNILDLDSDEVQSVTNGADPVDSVSNKQAPDPATVTRISNLAVVGKAMMQRANDNSFQTDFLLAKDALKNFEDGIKALQLDPESEHGMRDLIQYLRTKIEKRLNSNVHMTALE